MGATRTDGGQGASRHGTGVPLRRIALASLIGTTTEWYDFFLYGAMAALVFNRLFFPNLDPVVGTLAAFATFVAGFLARPVGSLLMGRFGRRVGRRTALLTSLSGMSLATIAIGALPTYDRIGIAAPVALTALRLVQGFALGGEWSAAATLTFEHAPKRRRGWWVAWAQYGVLVGMVLSAGTMLYLSATLTDRQFLTWGWRVPFLGAGLLLIVGLVLRLRLAGSAGLASADERDTEVRILGAVPRHGWTFLRVAGLHLVVTTLTVTTSTFVVSYGVTRAGYTRTDILQILCLAAAITMVLAPWIGHLCDVIGRRALYVLGTAAAMAGAFGAFALLDTGRLDAGVGAVLFLVLPIAALYQVQGAYFPELFPARDRVNGTGLGLQVATLAAGAPAPFIAHSLQESANGRPWSVSAYLCGVAFVSMLFAFGTPDKRPARVAATKRTARRVSPAPTPPAARPTPLPTPTAIVLRAPTPPLTVSQAPPPVTPEVPRAPVPTPTVPPPAALPGSRRRSAATASTEELVASWDLLSPTPPPRPADPADDRISRWEAAKLAARASAPTWFGPGDPGAVPPEAVDPAPRSRRRAHASDGTPHTRPAGPTTPRRAHAAGTPAPVPVVPPPATATEPPRPRPGGHAAQPGGGDRRVGLVDPGVRPAESAPPAQRRHAATQHQDELEHRLRERRRAVRELVQVDPLAAQGDGEARITPAKGASDAPAIAP